MYLILPTQTRDVMIGPMCRVRGPDVVWNASLKSSEWVTGAGTRPGHRADMTPQWFQSETMADFIAGCDIIHV